MAGTDFSKLVPGFDFLQGLVKNAGAGLPSMSQWIAPTLDPAEIEKRISELRTVQFWLEQNAKMIGATIQALEVQRMTLATLQTMNLPMSQLRDSMKLDPQPVAGAMATTESAAAQPAPAARKRNSRSATKPAAGASPAVDPMQWWGALTRQFSDLAAGALQSDAAKAAQPPLAGAPATAAASPDGKARRLPARPKRTQRP